jgi:lipopolysaccharide export system protein LptC
MTTEHTTTPKPRRRWLQFSLRTLLVLMLAFGCGLGWLGMKVKQAGEQREAVETTEERAMLTFGGTYLVEQSPQGCDDEAMIL